MNDATDWVLKTEVEGFTRHFAVEALPVTIGGDPRADIRLSGVNGTLSVGMLDGVFFIQPTRDTRNLRVAGEHVTGARKLSDGDIVALDTARITCRIDGGRLRLEIDARVTAGDTAPPDLEELARETRADEEIAITPVAFRPGAGQRVGRRKRPSIAAIAASFAFVVLAVLAWYAFTARSVSLEFVPEPEVVELPDTLFKVRVADRFMLRPGKHRVTAQLTGYYPLDTEIEVGLLQDQRFEFELTKLPDQVELVTLPETGAEVLVDGEPVGRTPLIAEIRPGRHRLEFRADRYLPELREIDVEGGGQRRALTVELTPSWAPVSIETTPAGATVLVDGEPAGTTPATLEIEAGRREIEVRLAGYNAWRTEVDVTANEPLTLPPIALVQADGRVELVSTPSEAAVSVDGEYRGRTPLTLSLRPGRAHRITLTKPGYEPVTRELTVEADSGRRIQIELAAQYGDVEIVSEPPQAEIWVDGTRTATTPATLKLTALPHEIEVRLDGYAARNAEVTPRPGFAQRLEFELEPLDDATGSGYPRIITTGLGQPLRLIPAGQFTMGSSRREPGRRSNETLRRVKLSRAFYLGVYEVTNAEFREFMADHDSGSVAGRSLNDDKQPVVNVDWEDAARFLNWLSIRDGLQPVYEESADGTIVAARPLRNGYRLPTEAEWEWAARFAERETALVYPWGTELPPPDRSGNFADVSAAKLLPTTLVTYNDGFEVTAPVGSFPADALGLHDIGGNVSEWIQDFYDVYPEGNTEQAVDPLGPLTGRFHVVRGPSWRSATQTNLRMAYRDYASEGRDDLGFRIARNLE
ncbi:MAG: PEGA domain-containing protein [Gammaproteobacteria bacterium]